MGTKLGYVYPDLQAVLEQCNSIWVQNIVRGSMGGENRAIFASEKLSKNCRFWQENRQKPIKKHYFLRFFLLPKNRL